MAPKLDSEAYLRIQEEAAAKNLVVGFQVRYPWGGEAGFSGRISDLGYEAMGREAAEALIAAEAAKFGIGDEGFTLLPIAAMFVK